MEKIQVKVPTEFKELYSEKWRNLIYYGGRAGGKSHAVAVALLVRGRQKKLRILCTREVQNTIRDSVHKLLSDKIEEHEFTEYEIQRDSIVNRITGTEFIFKGLRHNINEIKSTEGVDIAWIEEAQSITENSIDILTPTIRKAGSQLIFTFNRFNELDPVYQYFVVNKRPSTYIKQVNYDVMKNMGWLPKEMLAEIEADKANKALFNHKWLGEPISQSDKAVLNRTDVLEAMQRTIKAEGEEFIGVDVARFGEDRTVIFKRKGMKITNWKAYPKTSVDETVAYTIAMADKSDSIKVDSGGVGGGVSDLLRLQGYNAVDVNFGGKPNNPEKYSNTAGEMWFDFAKIIKQVSLPMDKDLLMELTTRDWSMNMQGKRIIEGKEHYKKRGYKSPDLADALILCFYMPEQHTYRVRTI